MICCLSPNSGQRGRLSDEVSTLVKLSSLPRSHVTGMNIYSELSNNRRRTGADIAFPVAEANSRLGYEDRDEEQEMRICNRLNRQMDGEDGSDIGSRSRECDQPEQPDKDERLGTCHRVGSEGTYCYDSIGSEASA